MKTIHTYKSHRAQPSWIPYQNSCSVSSWLSDFRAGKSEERVEICWCVLLGNVCLPGRNAVLISVTCDIFMAKI